MRALPLLALSVIALSLVAGSQAPASARSLPGPTVNGGPNCHAISRATGQDALFVGTVLGGQNRRGRWGDGTFRDYRTFQGCFVTAEACQAFVTRHQAHHPEAPGYGRCTAVFVGLTPAGRTPAQTVRVKY